MDYLRVVVTGGAGFIGSHVVEALLRKGAEVAVIDNLQGGVEYRPPKGVTFYHEDISSHYLHSIMRDVCPDYVIHHAAQVSVASSIEGPLQDAIVNITGTLNLLESCRTLKVKKFIFASSAAVYGDPLHLPILEHHPIRPKSPYALSKHTIERYLHMYKDLYGLDFTALRYANVYGPRQAAHGGDGGVVAVVLERILAGASVRIFGDGYQSRDFVYVTDVGEANLLALGHGSSGVFNISSSSQTTILELGRCISEQVGHPLKYEFFPARPGDVRHSSLSNAKAKSRLGWRPKVQLSDGIKRTLAHTLGR